MRKRHVENKDPFLSMGYGLIAYRRTLYILAFGFCLMSILAYPIIETFKFGGAISADQQELTHYGLFSIANLGYSTV
jgi:hypothetical protein